MYQGHGGATTLPMWNYSRIIDILLKFHNLPPIYLPCCVLETHLFRVPIKISVFDCERGVQRRLVNSQKYGVDLARFTHAKNACVHASTKVDDDIRLDDMESASPTPLPSIISQVLECDMQDCQSDFVAIADTFPCTTTSSSDTSRVTRSGSSVWRCLPRTIPSCPAASTTLSDCGISAVQHVLASCTYRKVNGVRLRLRMSSTLKWIVTYFHREKE